MIYGLYLSGQGAEAQALRQAVLANNMANAQTTAFKPDVPVFRAFPPFDVAQQNPVDVPDSLKQQTGGVKLVETSAVHAQGPLQVTQAPFDVAVVGPGFLQVDHGKQTVLTRNGKLSLNSLQQVITADTGDRVLGVDGQPIEIPAGFAGVDIGPDGTVTATASDGSSTVAGQLALVEPADGVVLKKLGNSAYAPLGAVRPASQAQLRQGVLEDSGVNPVATMVELIETSRAFEMNMNLVRFQDEMLGQLIQSIPRK